MTGRYDDVLERDWQAQVIEAAGYLGWRVAHFRTAQHGDRYVTPVAGDGVGFPDLLLIHPRAGDVIAAELKSEKGKPTPTQLQWLAWFGAAGIDNYVWRPHDIDVVLDRLQHPVPRTDYRGNVTETPTPGGTNR